MDYADANGPEALDELFELAPIEVFDLYRPSAL